MVTMSEEFRRKTMEGWEKAKEARAQRRKENREKWAKRRDWDSDNDHKLDTEVEDIPSEASKGSGSLAKMRAIMLDNSVALYRRLEAAEVVLSYELGPGAGVGIDPDEIAAVSFKFLRTVVDSTSTPEALRFRALKAIISVENARAQAKSTAITNTEKREVLLNLVNSERVSELRDAGVWSEVAKTDQQWALKWEDSFDWPDKDWPGQWAWPVSTMVLSLEQLSDIVLFRQALRSVRARNRVDDWERFLEPLQRPPEGLFGFAGTR